MNSAFCSHSRQTPQFVALSEPAVLRPRSDAIVCFKQMLKPVVKNSTRKPKATTAISLSRSHARSERWVKSESSARFGLAEGVFMLHISAQRADNNRASQGELGASGAETELHR